MRQRLLDTLAELPREGHMEEAILCYRWHSGLEDGIRRSAGEVAKIFGRPREWARGRISLVKQMLRRTDLSSLID